MCALYSLRGKECQIFLGFGFKFLHFTPYFSCVKDSKVYTIEGEDGERKD